MEKISLKYFGKGHTFMAADSFHQQVENGVCKRHYLYDVRDYIWAVNLCGMQ